MAKSSLYLRVVSALVLMPLALFCLVAGGIPFLAMIGVAVLLSLYEWGRMARMSSRPFVISFTGSLYLLVCIAAFAWLRLVHTDGAGLALALMICVWASDTGAYFAGKTIGGPKMAPSISPNKTWAGLIGGVAASAGGFALYALYIGPFLSSLLGFEMAIMEGMTFPIVLALGASITISGQIGDLLISKQKRVVGVKDTGHLIPGHGGLLDRIDSLLLAAPVFVLCLKALGL